MNSHPYGISKQLFRTSYSPVVSNSRPLSLNNSNFTPSLGNSSSQIRVEPVKTPILVKDSQQNHIPRSQTSILEVKTNLARNEYYP